MDSSLLIAAAGDEQFINWIIKELSFDEINLP